MSTLKALIREASAKAGGQNALARAIGSTSGNVSAWASGKRPCPDEQVIRMARIAGKPPMATAVEVFKERLGELAKTLAIGAVVMLSTFGASDHALAAAGHGEPMRDDV
jgi:DNA-binding transcriptional regulator YdaS (Cro superfamily)